MPDRHLQRFFPREPEVVDAARNPAAFSRWKACGIADNRASIERARRLRRGHSARSCAGTAADVVLRVRAGDNIDRLDLLLQRADNRLQVLPAVLQVRER